MRNSADRLTSCRPVAPSRASTACLARARLMRRRAASDR